MFSFNCRSSSSYGFITIKKKGATAKAVDQLIISNQHNTFTSATFKPGTYTITVKINWNAADLVKDYTLSVTSPTLVTIFDAAKKRSDSRKHDYTFKSPAYVKPPPPPKYPLKTYKATNNLVKDIKQCATLNRAEFVKAKSDQYRNEYRKWVQVTSTSW